MKIGIVVFCNLKYIPFTRVYTDLLEKNNHEFELIFWDRENLNEDPSINSHVYTKYLKTSSNKIVKFYKMFMFSRFVKRVIKREKYDKVIVLSPLLAVFLHRFLISDYNGKFLVDIRDFTYEHISIYKKLLKKIVSSSKMNVISSPYFKDFLPEGDYHVCHNINDYCLENKEIRSSKPRTKEVINISYIGLISYYDEVIGLLKCVGNDARFKFSLYGAGIDTEKIEKYCTENKLKNVYFHGSYLPKEKEGFYENTDVIYNVYGNNNSIVKYALSNKMYDAAWFRIPILVSRETAMAEMAGYIGFEFDSERRVFEADALYDWYNEKIDWDLFDESADSIMRKSKNENTEFKNNFQKLFLNIE